MSSCCQWDLQASHKRHDFDGRQRGRGADEEPTVLPAEQRPRGKQATDVQVRRGLKRRVRRPGQPQDRNRDREQDDR